MSQIRDFINSIASNKTNDARDVLNNSLQNKIMGSLEDTKKEIARSILAVDEEKLSHSAIEKKIHKGKNVGHGGFDKVEAKAAKEYGSEEAGKRVAAAVMWKKYGKKEETTNEALKFTKHGAYAAQSKTRPSTPSGSTGDGTIRPKEGEKHYKDMNDDERKEHLRKVMGLGVKKESAPPGWEGTVKAMKKEPGISNPFALSWWLKKHGAQSHIKASKPKSEETNITETIHQIHQYSNGVHTAYIHHYEGGGKMHYMSSSSRLNPPMKDHDSHKEADAHLKRHGFAPTGRITTEEVEKIIKEELIQERSTHSHEYKNVHGHSAFVNISRDKNKKTIQSHIPTYPQGWADLPGAISPQQMSDARGYRHDHETHDDAEKELKKHGYTYTGHVRIDRYNPPIKK